MSLVSDLLLPMRWRKYRAFLDRHEGDLLADSVDGQLAVIAHRYRTDIDFAERIGVVRQCLELGRFDGFDGRRRPLSYYFKGFFGPHGQMREWVAPQPPEDEPDPFLGQLSAVMSALLVAPTWELRRRILLGYPHLVHEGHLEASLTPLREQDSWTEVADALLAVVAAARAGRLQEAVWHAPATAFVRVTDDGQAEQFTVDEWRQLALLQYAETPAWHRRRELLNEYRDVLLAPGGELDERLDEVWDAIGESVSQPSLGVARGVFDDARRHGVDAAFTGPLPPTQVLMADAVWAFGASGGGLRRIADLRRLAHFYDPGVFPTFHARVAIQLAHALRARTEGELQAVFTEDAVRWARAAVNDVAFADGAELWREAYRALGAAHRDRIRGEPARHAEAAIGCFEKSLRAALAAGERRESGVDAVELSMCYFGRQMGSRTDNVELSIRYARQGLVALRDADRDVRVWAQVQLATALTQRHLGQQEESRAAAAEIYESALRELSAEEDPRTWAGVKVNLGSLYSVMGSRYADAALNHLTDALTVHRRDTDAYGWAQTQRALGVAYVRNRGDEPDGQERAKSHFAAALEVFTGEAFPALRRRCLVESGGVSFRQRRWAEALEKLQEAIALSDYLRDGLRTEEGRLAESADMRGVYERAAYCHVRLGRPAEGLQLIDAGKTRGMRVVIGGEIPPVLSVENIRAIADQEPVTVIPLVTSQGSCMFLLTSDPAEPPEGRIVPLPDLTDADITDLLDGTEQTIGWLFAYRGWRLLHDELGNGDQETADRTEAAYRQAHQTWATTITEGCATLWRRLMAPLSEALTDAGVPAGTPVRILPSRGLYLLPLHAAWRMCDGRPRAFLEDHPVSYAPSMWALARARAGREERDLADERLLVVVDSTGTLPDAETEADGIAAVFGSAATRAASAAVVEDLPAAVHGVTYLHFACHGSYTWGDPTASGLVMDAERLLAVREIAALPLGSTRLVTLSSCESGIIDADQVPNEYLGLGGSFLRAGAATVVSSLWSVDDESTAEIMAGFYRYLHHDKLGVAEALRRAQLDTIRGGRFRHPFFWAPFVAVGAC
ncbi:MAG TPA: CHAT domain-containing protein [Actinomycetes bacterium]|jgi:CHAT domain-containing protein/tetratricopeptide (TPR) repeat protein|nr:CHAT domain-containing protein [Actinomycetes bacterium]